VAGGWQVGGVWVGRFLGFVGLWQRGCGRLGGGSFGRVLRAAGERRAAANQRFVVVAPQARDPSGWVGKWVGSGCGRLGGVRWGFGKRVRLVRSVGW
jgi:hypothetical protein